MDVEGHALSAPDGEMLTQSRNDKGQLLVLISHHHCKVLSRSEDTSCRLNIYISSKQKTMYDFQDRSYGCCYPLTVFYQLTNFQASTVVVINTFRDIALTKLQFDCQHFQRAITKKYDFF